VITSSLFADVIHP